MTEISPHNIDDLHRWYRANARELPWRQTMDPYAIWISEIILQQTRVAQGESYYLRFLERFPTVETLAQAPVDDVLKLWEGLGYYSRANNLHRGARHIVNLGKMPENYGEWIGVPGVGPYTAAAISSIAHGEERAAVDGNVNRVISRLFALDEPIDSAKGKRFIRKQADKMIAGFPPSDHNQAMMELGAGICTPKNPSCGICPLQNPCVARKHNTQLQYPAQKKKTASTELALHYTALHNEKGIWVCKRSNSGIWKGLYELLPFLPGELNIPKLPSILIKEQRIKHLLTHRKLDIHIYSIEIEFDINIKLDNVQFVEIRKLSGLAFPRPIRTWLDENLLPLSLD